MDHLTAPFDWLQQTLFESVLQPMAFALGQGHWLEKAYEGAGWVVVGLLQMGVMLSVIGAMQRQWPVESQQDRQAVGVDVVYTLIHRLGLFKLGMFLTLDLALENAWGVLRGHGWPTSLGSGSSVRGGCFWSFVSWQECLMNDIDFRQPYHLAMVCRQAVFKSAGLN